MSQSAKTNSAEVKLSNIELRANFREPIIAAWDPQGTLVPALFRAFREWGLSLEQISWRKDPQNAGEVAITLTLLNGRMTFTTVSGPRPLWCGVPIGRRLPSLAS